VQTNHSLDGRLLHWIAEHRVGWLTSFTTHLMHVGQSPALIVSIGGLGLVIVVLFSGWRPALAVPIACYAGGVIAAVLKNHIHRVRPQIPDAVTQLSGYAMPSTHAAFTIAPVIALLVTVRWTSRQAFVVTATVLGLAVLLIGASMVYLGAHWATDVLAGWVLGGVIGAGVGAAFRPRTRQSLSETHRPVAQGHDHR
jgi:undecaprenyl-diphosphatase